MKRISYIALILSALFGFSMSANASHCGGDHSEVKSDKGHSEADHKTGSEEATSETDKDASATEI